MKTWMLRKTNNAFLAKISAPNLIHSMDLTAYTAGQVTFLLPSWLLCHAWHMHITATESLQTRRRRGGEQRGAEGSGGEGRGAEGREERDKHKSSCITLPQFLAQDQCSNVSFAVFTVVAQWRVLKKTRASWFNLGAVAMGKPIKTKSSTRKCGYRRPQKGLSAVVDLSLWSKHL